MKLMQIQDSVRGPSKKGSSVALVFIASMVSLAADAGAATYDVWTCRTPSGSPSATRDGGGGWSAAYVNTAASGGNLLEDGCGVGGTLRLRHAEASPQPAGSAISWTFAAPASTVIRGYELDFAGFARQSVPGGSLFGEVAVHTSDQLDPNYDERFYGTGPIARHLLTRTGKAARTLSVRADCSDTALSGEACAPSGYGAPVQVDIYRGTFTLEDQDAPAITSVTGDAITERLWAGTTGISVGATDEGGGVYRLGVEVDGQMRNWVSLAGASCRAWPGTERAFLTPKPCPGTVAGAQTISTAGLPEGQHTVRVLVEDAAGNQTTAYGPATKILEPSPPAAGAAAATDPGPLNGEPAVATARLRAS